MMPFVLTTRAKPVRDYRKEKINTLITKVKGKSNGFGSGSIIR